MTLQTLQIDDLDDKNPEDELQSCEHFLVDSEIKKTGLKVFNFAIESLSTKNVDEKTDQVYEKLNRAINVSLAFELILKNIEDGRFR